MISKEDVLKLKKAIDIIPFYERYLKLKRIGSSYFARCPFGKHTDSTPSFSILPEKNGIFKCFGCLPEYQEVRTENGIKKIKDIVIGENIYTLDGNLTKIINKKNHKSEYNIIKIKTANSYEYSYYTANHNMFYISKEQAVNSLPFLRNENDRDNLKFYKRMKKRDDKYKLNIEQGFAENIKYEDYFIYPSTREELKKDGISFKNLKTKDIKEIPLNEDIMWLFGLYIAEGSVYRGGVKWSLHIKEIDYALRIKDILKKYLNLEASIYKYDNKPNSLEIGCSKTDLELIFSNLFGNGSINKKYPYYFNYLSLNLRASLFKGMFDVDGCYSNNKYTTISPILKDLFFDLSISLNKIPSIYSYTNENKQTSYLIYIKNRESVKSFFYYINEIKYLFLQITDINKIDKCNNDVYDITVSHYSHSFLSKYFIVGNCGTSGDVISFYQRIENLSFFDAVIQLAKDYNVEIKINKELKQEYAKKNLLYKFNKHVLDIYRNNLRYNTSALKYLIEERKISLDMIKSFKIGTTLNDDLHIVLFKYKSILEELKLITEKNNDHFRNNRIMFPYLDEKFNISGFNSRAINEDNIKYLTSKTSPIFDKNRALYGIHLALKEIMERAAVILVEGQFDCIRCHQEGIKNCVAASGLALSEEQVKFLNKYVKTYFICFDNDEAGNEQLEATYIQINKINPYARVRIIELPKPIGKKKMDLDEYLLNNDKSEFLKIALASKNYNEYFIEKVLKDVNYKTIEEKKKYVYILKDRLLSISSIIDRNQYISMVANKLEIPEIDIHNILKNKEKYDNKQKNSDKIKKIEKRNISAQKYLISLLFSEHNPYDILKIFEELDIYKHFEPMYYNIFKYIEKQWLQSNGIDDIIDNVTMNFKSDESKQAVIDILFKSNELNYYDNDEIKIFIEDQISTLEESEEEKEHE